MQNQGLQSSLWMAGLLGHILLLLVLVVRGRVSRFPFFTVLIAFYIARTAIPQMSFTHTLSPTAFLWFFWGFEIGDIVLRAVVLGELLWIAFRPTTIPGSRVIAWSAVAVALAGALAMAIGPSHPQVQAMLAWSFFTKGNLTVAFLSVLVLAMLLFTRGTTGLSPRSQVFAIAGGLAFYAIVFLSLQAIRFWGSGQASPHGGGEHVSYLRYWMRSSAATAYLLVVYFWILRFWFDDRPTAPAPELIEA
jgi:hypothetical protein